jgi:hypothetical protein
MQAISIDELIKWMDKLEDLNGNNAASCWLSLKISLDALQEQAAQQSAQQDDAATERHGRTLDDDRTYSEMATGATPHRRR